MNLENAQIELPPFPKEILEFNKAKPLKALPVPIQSSNFSSPAGAPVNAAEISEVLDLIPPDCDYETWIKTLSALKFSGLKDLARTWSTSSSDPMHDANVFEKKWDKCEPIHFKTIYQIAKDMGQSSALSQISLKYMQPAATQDPPDLRSRLEFARSQFDKRPTQSPNIADCGFASDTFIWEDVSEAQLPRVSSVYASTFFRGYITLTAAAPKVGKSMISIAEAVDMASGRGIFLGGAKREKRKVLYFCAEDDLATLKARVLATSKIHSVSQEEITGYLYVRSGIDNPLHLIGSNGKATVVSEQKFVELEAYVHQHEIDCLIIDPLQDVSATDESNESFRLLGARLRKLAVTCNIAIGLVHHTRKAQPNSRVTIDDIRGGSALRGIARHVRLLVSMSDEQADEFGVADARYFIQVADAEGNLAPPSSEKSCWFEKKSVQLDNGANVGAVVRWSPPSAFNGIDKSDASRVHKALKESQPKWREHPNSPNWVGNFIADELGLDVESDKARIKRIIKAWLKNDVIRSLEAYSQTGNRDVMFIIAGENDPAVVNVP